MCVATGAVTRDPGFRHTRPVASQQSRIGSCELQTVEGKNVFIR